MPPDISKILEQLKGVSLAVASREPGCSRLASGREGLDQLFAGGLQYGQVSEWGVPLGCGGREVVSAFLAQATKQQPADWCLWAYAPDLQISLNAAALEARGIDLQYIRFAKTATPLKDLQPIFLQPYFRCVVLDMPRQLRAEDYAFLSRQAERHQQLIFILRPYFLSSDTGNVWCRLRVNCWQNTQAMHVEVLRGLSPRQATMRWPL